MTGSIPTDLSGNVILITGGARGIGGATAKVCAERGASVVIADYNAAQGEATAENLRKEGLKVEFIQTDVRDSAQVEAAVNLAVTKYGKLDRVVCAAGVLLGPWERPEDLSIEDFQKTIDINIKGVFLCAKHATPYLEAEKGVIIVIASGAGVIGPSSSLAYGASKGGANGLGMTLEKHLQPRGIRVNVLCPGNIITDMKMSVDVKAAENEGRPAQDAYDYAAKNYGVPEGVAKVIAFLLTPDAGYLRGTMFTR